MKKNVLIVCKTDLQRDPRVLKQIEALHDKYNLFCVGTHKSSHKGVFVDLDLFSLLGTTNSVNRITELTKLVTKRYKSLYWKGLHREVYNELKKFSYDLIICNETESLPIADRIAYKQQIPVYCDLHEFYPDDRKTGSFSKAQQLYEEWLLLEHSSRVKHFTTVSPQIIKAYSDRCNIDCSLLDNACRYYDLKPSTTNHKSIRLISHGAANVTRRLEVMIEAMSLLDDRYSLDLYLVENASTYMEHLKQLVVDNSRVNILPPIPFDRIQETINNYDIGLYLLYPTNINNTNALPNKIYEFIQGRVAIAIGPTPAMADIVNEHDIGVVSKEFTAESLAKAILNLTVDDIDRYKSNTNKTAVELNSEKNIKQIQSIIRAILG